MCDKTLQYNPDSIQCDFDDRVDCGDRPICNSCDGDCHGDPTSPPAPDPDCGPEDHHPDTICQGKQDGWWVTVAVLVVR